MVALHSAANTAYPTFGFFHASIPPSPHGASTVTAGAFGFATSFHCSTAQSFPPMVINRLSSDVKRTLITCELCPRYSLRAHSSLSVSQAPAGCIASPFTLRGEKCNEVV
jgi:hypothetical protein